MQYGLRLKGETLEQLTDWARKAEAARFDMLWAQELYTTPFVYPAAVAGSTSSIGLGSCIALAFVRSPLVTALTALDLDRLTSGRYVLGLGTGVQRLNARWHGVQDYGRPAPHLKECIRAVRYIMEAVHTGAPIAFEGEYYDIAIQGFQLPNRPFRERIPIFAAAMGPGMVRAMSEVADGLLGQTMPSLRWVKDVILPNMEIGLKRAGRERGDIHLSPAVTLGITRDVKKAKRDLSKTVSFYCTVGTYTPLFRHYGFSDVQQAIREQFQKHGTHGEHCFELVPEEMVDAFFVAGTPDEARRLLAQYEGTADSVILSPPSYFLSHEEVEDYQDAILETFAR